MLENLKNLSLSAQSLWALFIGVLFGLFFGEDIAWIQTIGDVYIKLMQITIIPYIMVSIMVGLGSMSYQQAKEIAVHVGKILLLIWAIGLVLIFLSTLAYPDLTSASFFSDSTIQPPPQIDYLKLYIPSNPISSMAEGSIPAIVIFSIAVAVALIGIEDKDSIVKPLETMSEAFTRVAKFMIKTTPIGIFAITAASAGTLSVEDFEKLQIYLIVYTLVVVLLTFWILPLLITIATPFKYKDILSVTRSALITGFATSNLFIVLPMIIEGVKELFSRYQIGKEDEVKQYADTIIPVTFNFPALGKLMALMFVLFAAWFLGIDIPVHNYPEMGISAVLSFFGSLNVALPALLEQYGVPNDMFRLFLVSGLVIGKVATLVAVMNLFVLTVIASSAMMNITRINYKRISIFSIVTFLIVLGSIYATKLALSTLYKSEYKMDKIVLNMQVLEQIPEDVHRQLDNASMLKGDGVRTLDQILESGKLNIGYLPQKIPFSYFNNQGKLVGFDIDMMYRLAKDLDLKLEFVPYTFETGLEMLNTGKIDLAISGIHITPARLSKMEFTEKLLDMHLAVLIKEKDRAKFGELDQSLTGTVTYSEDIPEIRNFRIKYPNLKFVKINSVQDFFNNKDGHFDGYLTSMQTGTAWTLLYPTYTILFNPDNIITYPMAYAVARGNYSLKNFMDNWIELQKYNKKIDKSYNYWVQGKGAEPEVPRWSIKRDVLGW